MANRNFFDRMRKVCPPLLRTMREKVGVGGAADSEDSVPNSNPNDQPINLFCREVQQAPYSAYEGLRSNWPVYHDRYRDVWAISRYEDVVTVIKNPEVFSSRRGASIQSTLSGADVPEHTRHRKIAGPAFSAKRMAGLESRVQSVADELVDGFAGQDGCDIATKFSSQLPMMILVELMNIVPERQDDMRRWSNAVLTEDNFDDEVHKQEIFASMQECWTFAEELVRQAGQPAASGLIAEFIRYAELAGSYLTPKELIDITLVFVVAGFETASNLIGNALLVLAKYPDVQRQVRRNPKSIPKFIEEVLRLESPVQRIHRRTESETTIAGCRIPAQARIMLLLGSANRDPDQFEHPDEFRIDRRPNDHLAFGKGIHFCIGAGLARLQARISIETLLNRMPQWQIDSTSQVEFQPFYAIRGVRRLPIVFTNKI